MTLQPCPHERGRFVRVPFKSVDREGNHVMEQCPLCLVNVRGPGVWVKQSELSPGTKAEDLPLKQEVKNDQPGLF